MLRSKHMGQEECKIPGFPNPAAERMSGESYWLTPAPTTISLLAIIYFLQCFHRKFGTKKSVTVPDSTGTFARCALRQRREFRHAGPINLENKLPLSKAPKGKANKNESSRLTGERKFHSQSEYLSR